MNLARFYELAEQLIDTFSGIVFADGDLAEAVRILKQGRNILYGWDTVLVGALALGIDAVVLTTLNVEPEIVRKIWELVGNNKWNEARGEQVKLNQRVWQITEHGEWNWIEAMKTEFNKINTVFQVGPWRKPTAFKNH